MATMLKWQAVCGDCGARGPEAESSPEAKELALEQGWSIVRNAEDYCPSCRIIHDRIQCQHRSNGAACISDSRYRLSRAAGLFAPEEIHHALASLGISPEPVLAKLNSRVKDKSQWWVCGKHLPVFSRDMFNATPEPVVVVRVTS